MSPFDLNGKTILVTGASSGLGRQTAVTASKFGARIVITGRNTARLEETYQLLQGDGHLQIPADLTVQTDIDRLVNSLPLINGLVHSTGISDITPARFITKEVISKTFSICFEASVLVTAGVLAKKKLVKDNSSIVFISSVSTTYPFIGGGMYISAKAAVEAYALVLAKELAPRGTRVNCISPAFVRTPMLDETAENFSMEVINRIEQLQVLGLGDPEDVAHTIIYYISDASKWVSGTNLILGGGLNVQLMSSGASSPSSK